MKHALHFTLFFLLTITVSLSAQSGPNSFFGGPEEEAQLSVYPNPAVDFIEISGETTAIKSVVVYSMVGRAVKEFKYIQGERLYVADLPNGMYLVQMLDSGNKIVHTHRMNKRA